MSSHAMSNDAKFETVFKTVSNLLAIQTNHYNLGALKAYLHMAIEEGFEETESKSSIDTKLQKFWKRMEQSPFKFNPQLKDNCEKALQVAGYFS